MLLLHRKKRSTVQCVLENLCILSYFNCIFSFFSSPELAQGELLGYRDVRRPSYVWTSVTSETSETYETSETSVRQLFSLCTL